jgi:hypothetical protein
MQALQHFSESSSEKVVNDAQRSKNKTRNISFRVTEEQYAEIERVAFLMKEGPNSCCRRITLTGVRGGPGLTRTEQLLHKDIARVRYLMEATFGMLFGSDQATNGRSTPEVNQQTKEVADDILSTEW